MLPGPHHELAPTQEPFPPHNTEGFAPTLGGGGELKSGLQLLLDTSVSLLLELKLSLGYPEGFPPVPAPELILLALLHPMLHEQLGLRWQGMRRTSVVVQGSICACKRILRSRGWELEMSGLMQCRARGWGPWRGQIRRITQGFGDYSSAMDLRSKWAISPYLVPLKEKLVLAASSALPS